MQVDVLFAPKEASQDSLRTAVEAVKKPDSTFHKPFLLFDLCKVVLGDAQEWLGKKKADGALATSLQGLLDTKAITVREGEGWEHAALQSAISAGFKNTLDVVSHVKSVGTDQFREQFGNVIDEKMAPLIASRDCILDRSRLDFAGLMQQVLVGAMEINANWTSDDAKSILDVGRLSISSTSCGLHLMCPETETKAFDDAVAHRNAWLEKASSMVSAFLAFDGSKGLPEQVDFLTVTKSLDVCTALSIHQNEHGKLVEFAVTCARGVASKVEGVMSATIVKMGFDKELMHLGNEQGNVDVVVLSKRFLPAMMNKKVYRDPPDLSAFGTFVANSKMRFADFFNVQADNALMELPPDVCLRFDNVVEVKDAASEAPEGDAIDDAAKAAEKAASEKEDAEDDGQTLFVAPGSTPACGEWWLVSVEQYEPGNARVFDEEYYAEVLSGPSGGLWSVQDLQEEIGVEEGVTWGRFVELLNVKKIDVEQLSETFQAKRLTMLDAMEALEGKGAPDDAAKVEDAGSGALQVPSSGADASAEGDAKAEGAEKESSAEGDAKAEGSAVGDAKAAKEAEALADAPAEKEAKEAAAKEAEAEAEGAIVAVDAKASTKASLDVPFDILAMVCNAIRLSCHICLHTDIVDWTFPDGGEVERQVPRTSLEAEPHSTFCRCSCCAFQTMLTSKCIFKIKMPQREISMSLIGIIELQHPKSMSF